MKVVVCLKGGKGSGHHGHSGRPGMVGGSTSGRSIGGTATFDTFAEFRESVKSGTVTSTGTYMGVAAFILPDDRLVGGNEHSVFLHQSKDNDALMDTLGISKDMVSDEMSSMIPAFKKIFENGTIRVRITSKYDTAIQSDKLDTKTLRRLQKLVDAGKIDMDIRGSHTWESNFGKDNNYVDFTMAEFMSAKRVVDIGGKLTLKEQEVTIIRTKGGKGSGHHGHSGRPGMVGGSSAGRGSGMSDGSLSRIDKSLSTRLMLNDIRKFAEEDPDGYAAFSTIKDWPNMEFEGIQAASHKIISGSDDMKDYVENDRQVLAANAMVDIIRTKSPESTTLYRGVNANDKILQDIASGEINLDRLSSFSVYEKTAKIWAKKSPIIFRTVGKLPSIDVGKYAMTGDLGEFVTFGKFKVVSSRKEGDTTYVDIQHVSS